MIECKNIKLNKRTLAKDCEALQGEDAAWVDIDIKMPGIGTCHLLITSGLNKPDANSDERYACGLLAYSRIMQALLLLELTEKHQIKIETID